MQFGTKKKDAPERNGTYLRGFKAGETKVRMLEEVDDWYEFYEHRLGNQSFPCTRDRATCPGCTHDNEDTRKSSRRYGTYVYLIDQKVTLPFKIPATLCDRFEVRSERNDKTLLNRDYVVIRKGTGFDTEYDVDQEDKYDLNIEGLLKDCKTTIQDALLASYNEVWGEGTAKLREVAERDASQDDVPPSEPGAKSDSAGQPGENAVVTEAQVRAMEKPQLRDLCDRGGVAWDDDDTKGELVEKLLAKFAA